MKRTIVLLSVIALMASCNKVLDKLGTFNVKRTGEFTVPASSTFGTPVFLETPFIASDYKKEFENAGYSTDNVDHFKLTKMIVKIKSPAGANFDPLASMKISISADGLPEVEIASKATVPTGVTEMEIDVTSVDLKQYLMKENFAMKAEALTDEAIASDMLIEAEGTFEVKANLLK